MITIGQLARYVGVSTKTIRVYHAKGLLPEPDRDASGYRRYTAGPVIDLIKIRTLAAAGVPLARIRDLKDAPEEDFRAALQQIDRDLTARIHALRRTQRHLRRLDVSHLQTLPRQVADHLGRLPELGFSSRWVAMETDLWILLFATHPDPALELFRDQADAVADPVLCRIYLAYDRAHDLDTDDPRLEALARDIVTATSQRYGTGERPGQSADPDLPALVQAAVNASSPARTRLDTLIRRQLST